MPAGHDRAELAPGDLADPERRERRLERDDRQVAAPRAHEVDLCRRAGGGEIDHDAWITCTISRDQLWQTRQRCCQDATNHESPAVALDRSARGFGAVLELAEHR